MMDDAKLARKRATRAAYMREWITRAHLEKQFTRRMSWDNYGSYWHLDHIIPMASFKFDTPDDDAFKMCWAITNLRPLAAQENMQKGPKRTLLL